MFTTRYLNTLRTVSFCLLALLAGCATGPEQAQTPYISGVVDSRDGVPVVYESFGEGETAVVFIHCWACNRAFWRHQIEPLVAAGYQVVTLDLPGHGESGANREAWSMAGLADDVIAVIDELDLQRVILMGHSIGARASLVAAHQMPDRVIGIGCADTFRNAEFEWPEGAIEVVVDFVREDFLEGLKSIILPVVHPGTDPELIEWIFAQAIATDHTAVIALLEDFPTADLAVQLSAAGVPIRCINAAPRGRQSRPTEIEINRKYADFDAVLMEDVGHYLQLERPEEFNEHLLDLLTELSDQHW